MTQQQERNADTNQTQLPPMDISHTYMYMHAACLSSDSCEPARAWEPGRERETVLTHLTRAAVLLWYTHAHSCIQLVSLALPTMCPPSVPVSPCVHVFLSVCLRGYASACRYSLTSLASRCACPSLSLACMPTLSGKRHESRTSPSLMTTGERRQQSQGAHCQGL